MSDRVSSQSEHYPRNLLLEKVSSKAVCDRMHHYVNLGKALFRRGYCSNGRTFNLCFAVKKGKIIAIGMNDYDRQMIGYNRRLRTVYKASGEESYVPSLHAEVSAILKLGVDDCSSISFYNVRINKHGKCCNSQPCLNCLTLLQTVSAKNIYCYDDDMNISEVISFS